MTTRARLFGIAFLTLGVAMLAVPGTAVPITSYDGTLITNVTRLGQVGEPGQSGSPADDFWMFSGTMGQLVTITVNRLEAALDPVLVLYQGTGVDTVGLVSLASRDDNYPELPGFAGPFADPQLLNFALPATGNYTVHVWSFISDDPGGDGVYDYQITLGDPPTGPVDPVPEPSTMLLIGSGLLSLAARRRRTS